MSDELKVVGPGKGRSVALGGIGAVFKLSSKDTGGLYSIVEHPLKPGALVPPHTHSNEDEVMYVLQGEIGARVGDQELRASAGSYILKPKGVPHTFWNSTNQPAVIMHILSPGGFEGYFAELAELIPENGPPDFAPITELAARYGCTFNMDWVPELERKYKVSVYAR